MSVFAEFKPGGPAVAAPPRVTDWERALKALPPVRDLVPPVADVVSGWALRFGSLDVQGDAFAHPDGPGSRTDYGFLDGARSMLVPLLLEHDPNRPVGVARIARDDGGWGKSFWRGLWADAFLDVRRNLDWSKLGFSTACDVPKRITLGGVSTLKSWPLVELSLSPSPINGTLRRLRHGGRLALLKAGCNDIKARHDVISYIQSGDIVPIEPDLRS